MSVESPPGLVIVDMQRYYLDPKSDFSRFHESRDLGGTHYIQDRAKKTVIPNIQSLLTGWRANMWPVFYLRLCGIAEDRSDLHRFFRSVSKVGGLSGFPGMYPIASDPMSDVTPEIAPEVGDGVFTKTTFSGFSSGHFAEGLIDSGVKDLVFTGLATSQCVETTARDASDRGYRIIQVEDAQADYSESTHRMSLLSSRGVCGGVIVDTESLLDKIPNGIAELFAMGDR